MEQEKLVNVLGSKEYDVNVITTADGDTLNGQVATWVVQASLEPPLLCVFLAPTRYTFELIKKSMVLAVNVLSKDQTDLVPNFGYSSGRDGDKFANIPHKKGVTGSPIIDGIFAYMDCKVKQIYPAGDHQILLSEIVDADFIKGGEKISYQWLASQNK